MSECALDYVTRIDLNRHVNQRHKDLRPFKCNRPDCESSFQMKTHLTAHVATVHDKAREYLCETCGMTFGMRWNRDSHVRRIHAKLRPHICPVPGCELAFAQKYDMQRHCGLMHSSRVLRCLGCDASFSTSSALHAHVPSCPGAPSSPQTRETSSSKRQGSGDNGGSGRRSSGGGSSSRGVGSSRNKR
jgi:uncharacterized membrane protein YgcG